MKLLMLAITGVMAAMALVRRGGLGQRMRREVAKRTHTEDFTQHRHDALLHDHPHTHVVHNRREGADEFIGEWEHLTAEHTHRHNHAELVHSHAPHESVEREHLGEAHIHDHEHPEKS
jgi:hypothetical protein